MVELEQEIENTFLVHLTHTRVLRTTPSLFLSHTHTH